MNQQPIFLLPVKIDSLGRIVIPKELRQAMGLVPGSLVDFSYDGEQIVLTKSKIMGELANQMDTLQGQIQLLSKGDEDESRRARQMMDLLDEMRGVLNR